MSSAAKPAPPHELPLAVDLDGTLVRTDLLIEAVMQLAKEHPGLLLMLPFWLARGKAHFKDEVFSRVDLAVESLPYNQPFLDYLKAEHERGRTLILATASSAAVAKKVAEHVGIFDAVMGSDAAHNLSGRNKATALVKQFGARNFAYAGNDDVDLHVWREAGEAFVVNPTPGLARKAAAVCKVGAVYDDRKSFTKLMFKAMRVHQWAKNVLIFTPLIFAHRFGDVSGMLKALIAFFAFTFTSSSVYLLNDLLDLESDRRHVEKRRRPFASGDLALKYGMLGAPALFVLGMGIAASFSPLFLAVLLGYYVVTLAYSLRLKEVVLADVMILAFLYAWRVFAGAVATGITLSAWFLAFFGFIFFSLALMKRASELILTVKSNGKANSRRGYRVEDLNQLVSFGSSSGYLAVLVLALYGTSPQVAALYERPQLLWLVCPLLLYWVSRMWLKAHRGEMPSDPLVFALKDRVSYIIIGVMAVIWIVAAGHF
jgi:4-hydroxybenzoate polyprenyltransferase/phosphoserine phosphatase